MRQRGRKSADLVAIGGLGGKPQKLTPPADLQEAERAMFVELIDACDARHFRLSDLPLLTSYIQATLLARGTARDPNNIAVWEKAVRVQASLATRLRLSPQSRTDPKTIARQPEKRGLLPWEL
jgi:hypothetical protein